ncbi:1-acyl-sn-glycerol-3-phosphate acyltransferase epsilon-like [Ruditapes philippinarum]|uniref:1-acyl-sn-glycerol-3-phosphate acyltransferase epsilon-like n=1 Tax=Ruditapes philippinarum TaxID=129788 RepID=UPI00295B2B81|nr:1-acyl-sn-glycerol-3-phosphate acyltransferase epsilon-like [Ruditapes philippinarum]
MKYNQVYNSIGVLLLISCLTCHPVLAKMFSILFHAHSLRWSLPTAIMIGSSPTFITLWGAMRILTLCLPRRIYTSADDCLYSLYQKLILFFFHTYTGAEVQVYGDVEALLNEKKSVIFICNHQCTVDWIIANMLASPQSCIGRIRYVLKDGLRFFPLYGFYFRQHSCIYVKKSGKFDQDKAEKQLAQLKTNDIPVWLVIFPEGTRMNPDLPDVIERSKNSAIEQVMFEKLKHHVDAIYDVTIGYSDSIDPETGCRIAAPGMTEFLSLNNPGIHLHFNKVPIQDIPMEETDLKQWLFSTFRQKDKLISHFYSSLPEERGRFPGQSVTLKIPASSTVPSFLFFSSCLVFLLSRPEGRTFYWKTYVFGTILGCLWMCIRS